ncbi:MAG: glycosyltransferase family 4 protein [Caldilineales bacterium]|nr:glycosyltransferase family 4 protein [Caldilineales bacterium]
MRVVMLSKACIVGAYQRKLEELGRLPDIELTVLAPPSWQDSRGMQKLERVFTQGYELRETPLALNGRFHWHFYPRLAQELDELKPDILHIDEEPYNFATRHALGLARARGIAACFFTWQNLNRRYPPPFSLWERYAYRHSAHAIAGNRAAAEVLRSKGYRGPLSVIPQFGIDPDLFCQVGDVESARPFTIGYAGGLVPEKGLDTLLRACAMLVGDWQLRLAGSGAQEQSLKALAAQLGIEQRIGWDARIPSTEMPAFYQTLDAFVLPSRTRTNWMEQFGRVLVEAMACGVPVVGSNSGEIPRVIGDAGLIFPEGDERALAGHLQALQAQPDLRATLGAKGRRRALERFTQAQVAADTYQVYLAMMETKRIGRG